MKIDVTYDATVFIDVAVHEVYKTLAEAIVLVLVVIWLFLGSARSALVPAVTVPVCVMAAFMPLLMFGFSINLLTLLALVLSIGLVVDDAIVVLENIQRRADLGEPPPLAALRGTRQVGVRGDRDDGGAGGGVPADRVPAGQQRPPVPRTGGRARGCGRDLVLRRAQPDADDVLAAGAPAHQSARHQRVDGSAPARACRIGYRRVLERFIAYPLLVRRGDGGCAAADLRPVQAGAARAGAERGSRLLQRQRHRRRKARASTTPCADAQGREDHDALHRRRPAGHAHAQPRARRLRRVGKHEQWPRDHDPQALGRARASAPTMSSRQVRRDLAKIPGVRAIPQTRQGLVRSGGQPLQVVLEGPDYRAARAVARPHAGEDGPEPGPVRRRCRLQGNPAAAARHRRRGQGRRSRRHRAGDRRHAAGDARLQPGHDLRAPGPGIRRRAAGRNRRTRDADRPEQPLRAQPQRRTGAAGQRGEAAGTRRSRQPRALQPPARDHAVGGPRAGLHAGRGDRLDAQHGAHGTARDTRRSTSADSRANTCSRAARCCSPSAWRC